MAKKSDLTETLTQFYDTTVKLGAIEEAQFLQEGDVVVKVDRASGEVTVRGPVQHARSTEAR
jgi:protein involved in polysaccharide export with SLBB domain